jgi:dTDP-4-dehydrorhamnose reductase
VTGGPLRVAVLGSSGQLGSDVCRVLGEEGRFHVGAYARLDLDVTDAESVDRELGGGHFDVVINTAALTNVDRCEEHGEEALAVNATGAYLPARACRRAGARYVLISTDFVFDGSKEDPYDEDDRPAPVNLYGASKLAGEMTALLAQPTTLVLRISSVFGKSGARGKGGNFVESILRQAREGAPLRVVDDLRMSPTYTVDVANAVPSLLAADAGGIVHLANSGSCSWHEFAQAALELAGIDRQIERVPSHAFPRPARRPVNSALASRRVENLLGRGMRPWREALSAYLTERGHLVGESGKDPGTISEEPS